MIRKFKILLPLLVTFCLSMSLGQNVWAQSSDEAIGKARLVIGDVMISSSISSSGSLKVGDNIFLGDQVTTPTTGYAVITLNEGTKFTVKPKSVFRFDTVDDAGGKVITNLIKGGLKSITGSIGSNNPEGFKVDTPLGTIGIRGTDFDALLCLSDEDCSLLNEALGCPDTEPVPVVGLLYVTVNSGVAYLDQCDEDLDISPGQTGTTDGTQSSCKLLEDTPCFLQDLNFDINNVALQPARAIDDDIGEQCQGDPLCMQCQGDSVCMQCDGDALCMQCQGDALCMQCQGDALCMQCQGDALCMTCQGDAICLQCQGDANCLACQGDPLCLQCNGDPICIDCNGDAACINPPVITPPMEEPPMEIDPCNGDPICQICDGDAICLMCNADAACINCGDDLTCKVCLTSANPSLCENCASTALPGVCESCGGTDGECYECAVNPNAEICQPELTCTPNDLSGCPTSCFGDAGFDSSCLCEFFPNEFCPN